MTLDTRAFNAALRARVSALADGAKEQEERMANDYADRARSVVARLTGATAASIEVNRTGTAHEVRSDNSYLELGTSDTAPQPFMRPAGAVVAAAFRSGQYKPDF